VSVMAANVLPARGPAQCDGNGEGGETSEIRMNANLAPEHSYMDRRIDRAYTRMLAAKTTAWAHAWGDAFVANVSARNAMRTVAEVRRIEIDLGLVKQNTTSISKTPRVSASACK
jgi:hypothetical protein